MSGPGPSIILNRAGPSYIADVPDLGARITFRDVRADRELSADVAVNVADVHVFRTHSTLSLTGRDKLARTAHQMAPGTESYETWRHAVFAAVEAVLVAEEQLGNGVDLRSAGTVTAEALWIAYPFQPSGPSALVGPGESGKSTIARSLALSIAANQTIIPGIAPRVSGPVLYVAGEDSGSVWHARNLEAIAKGANLERASVRNRITLMDARGRKLHRIGRAIAERANDHALVVLDSQQALLPSMDSSGGGVRDRDSAFFDAVDMIARPVLIIAHPNLTSAKQWARADGRVAGSEVNRDRLRMAWRLDWKDEPAVVGTSFRRYTLTCTKWNHGPRPAPIAFGAGWTFGDPGTVRFSEARAITTEDREPTPVERSTVEAWTAGARTPATMGAYLNIDANTAKARITRAKERGLINGPAEATA